MMATQDMTDPLVQPGTSTDTGSAEFEDTCSDVIDRAARQRLMEVPDDSMSQ